jgi:hypothetical protein
MWFDGVTFRELNSLSGEKLGYCRQLALSTVTIDLR